MPWMMKLKLASLVGCLSDCLPVCQLSERALTFVDTECWRQGKTRREQFVCLLQFRQILRKFPHINYNKMRLKWILKNFLFYHNKFNGIVTYLPHLHRQLQPIYLDWLLPLPLLTLLRFRIVGVFHARVLLKSTHSSAQQQQQQRQQHINQLIVFVVLCGKTEEIHTKYALRFNNFNYLKST